MTEKRKIFSINSASARKKSKDPVRDAESAILAGDLVRADEIASEYLNLPEMYAVKALLALLDGRRAEAGALYEEGMKGLRRALSSRKAYFGGFAGLFYGVLLLAEGDFKKAFAAISAGEEGPHYSGPNALLKLVANHRSGKSGRDFFILHDRDLTETGRLTPLGCLIFSLCLNWLAPERLEDYKKVFGENLKGMVKAAAPRLYITEVGEIFGIPVEDPVKRVLPLHGILPREERWKMALSALAALGGNREKEKKRERRLSWEVNWQTDGVGLIHSINFAPLEQVLQASGKWSKGRAVALKRLRNDLVRESWMTRFDIAAAGAVVESGEYNGWGYKKCFEFDEAKILKALVGHPFVMRADGGGPVEIVADEPRLEVERGPAGVILRLNPNLSASPFRGLVAMDEGPNRIRVVPFDDKHLEMTGIIGEEGLSVPSEGGDEVVTVLESLVPLISVNSEVDGVRTAREAEADEKIYIELSPGGDGFTVLLTTRPLGPGTPVCRPGTGGKIMLGLVDGHRVKTIRSLEEEAKNAEEIRALCPSLDEGEQADEYRWILGSPELCLDFLLQAGELGDRATIEWPRGGAIKIRAKADNRYVKASLRSGKDWFALSGEIRVDEDTVLSLREACRLVAEGGSRFLPLGEGEFLALTEELRKSLADAAAAGDWRGNDLRFSPLSAPLVERITSGAGEFSGDDEWLKKLALAKEAAELEPELPAAFRGELRDYQADGYKWLARLAAWGAGACLADDMGLGKTIQALALLLSRASDGPALVVAPLSVCQNWFSEAARFAPSLNLKEYRSGDRKKLLEDLKAFDVVVTSYGLLQHDGDLLEGVEWNTVVLDEAQAIKNSGAKRSAAAMKLRGAFRVITTGTPVENNLGELWNLFRFLNPGLLGSLEGFNRRFATPIEKFGDKGAASRLKKLLRPFLLRRTKEQVLSELPPKTEIVLRVEMSAEERAVYEAVRREASDRIESEKEGGDTRFIILAELMRLRRACCSSSLVLPEAGVTGGVKTEAFGEILDELTAGGHRCLVFSQFVDHLSIIREYLDGRAVPYSYLDGATPQKERERQIASFQRGEKQCFLISLRAGGTGLNLTAADYVVHMDPWWNPAVEDQASDRAHRIGQERPVTVYRIVAKDTVEEKIVDLHSVKRELAENLLEGAEKASRISLEEMTALIREGGGGA